MPFVRSTARRPQPRHRAVLLRPWLVLTALVLPVMLISIDMTVLSFALPSISEAMGPTGTQLLWITDSYSLAIAGLLVTMGSLGDRYGSRRLLLIGAAGFGLVSLVAAFAQTPAQLIAARIALGVFGATLMPSTLSLLRSTFTDGDQRRLALAVWAGGFAAGGALGPIVGGWLLEHFWWGSVFLLNVPFMVALLVLTPLVVREHRPGGGRIDPLSVVLSVIALAGLVYSVKSLAEHGLQAPALAALGVSLVAGGAFIRRQLRLDEPLLAIDLFRLPVFRASVLANLMSICGLTGMLFAVSQYLQLVIGLRPSVAGLVLLPGAIATFVMGIYAAQLAHRVRLEVLVTAGLLLGAAGYLVLAVMDPATGTAVHVAVAFLVLSAGAGFAETLTNDAILSAAPARRSGAASAISETAYEVGSVLGTTVLGSILNAVYRHQVTVPAGTGTEQADDARQTLGGAVEVAAGLPGGQSLLDSARTAFGHGLEATAAAGVALTATAAAVVWWTLRRDRSRGEPGGADLPSQGREETTMPKTSKSGKAVESELPSTLQRSDDKAQQTFAKAHDSAADEYHDEQRANRVAWGAVKHTHEKVGDHWEPKEDGRKGPSDPQSAGGVDTNRRSSGGVDEHASKEHLLQIARDLDVSGRSSMDKGELVDAIRKANDAATAKARE